MQARSKQAPEAKENARVFKDVCSARTAARKGKKKKKKKKKKKESLRKGGNKVCFFKNKAVRQCCLWWRVSLFCGSPNPCRFLLILRKPNHKAQDES